MNKDLFRSSVDGAPRSDAVNAAGGVAYAMPDKHALAQYVTTGTFNSTYYTTDAEHLKIVLGLCAKVPADFVARAAVYAHRKAFMRDMPAFLCAYLAAHDLPLLKKVFPIVITNGKMLRNFVQIIRSGVVGRKSFGTAVKHLIQDWLNNRDPDRLFGDTVGNDPSIVDAIKMVHPKAKDDKRQSLFRYILGKEHCFEDLPDTVRAFELYKRDHNCAVPDVDFRMLTALDLGIAEWTAIAKQCSWQTLRMNLNTFERHGVFKDKSMVELVANRLRDANEIHRSKVFPYQLLMAYLNASDNLDMAIKLALQDAMEIAIDNVPAIPGSIYIFVDVSGSMSSPATGMRKGSTTKARCVDVAGLIAAAFLRKNERAVIVPFTFDVINLRINPRDSVMTNAQKLGSICGGGTDCSKPMALLNHSGAGCDLVVYVSDNESWIDTDRARLHYNDATNAAQQWIAFSKRNPKAKMVCIDLTPNTTVQIMNRDNVLNIGGWSDACFDVINAFVEGGNGNRFVEAIERIVLDKGSEQV